MKQTVYIVKAGDTIEEISNRHGVDRDVLMDKNNIKEPNYIHVGQQLIIPIPAGDATSEENGFSEFWLYFVDAVGMPIAGLNAHIYAGPYDYRLSTDSFGVLPPIRIYGTNVRPRVFVEKIGGGEKFLSELKMFPGSHQFTFHSPSRLLKY
ncbi:LysM peptidoglycan-binding domain-containing protein [Cupriavidus sp. D384]|uniref:LysM peptidoglycan-binding domain-containing protein n=1 Tax=Cupriavidus sp. D384 TaxID=1538095 RepID=UPI0008298582|nr:LysM peptidoglycan-binding domain-containing protein [Cupriavidus sp. D384]